MGVEKKDAEYVFIPTMSVVFNIPILKTFSFRPEFGYRKQGYSVLAYNKASFFYEAEIYGQQRIIKAQLNYLEIPLNVIVKLPFHEKRFEVLLGATIGRCMGGKGDLVKMCY